MADIRLKEIRDVFRHKMQSIKRKIIMGGLSKELIDVIRLQMLFNIGNGWSWYAYQKLGPEAIIDVELEMWDNILPPAVERLLPLIDLQGSRIEKAKILLGFISQINGYKPRFEEETPRSLLWEYAICPNWESMLEMKLDDYLPQDGNPARVSCIHGCTRIHEHYFQPIAPGFAVKALKTRPGADNTCLFELKHVQV